MMIEMKFNLSFKKIFILFLIFKFEGLADDELSPEQLKIRNDRKINLQFWKNLNKPFNINNICYLLISLG